MVQAVLNPKSLDDINSLAVIGAGKIGSAIIKAVRKCYSDLTIIATGRREKTLVQARELGAIATRDNNEAVRKSDFIVLSVKPYHFPVVLRQVEKSAWRDKIVLSVMAGVKLSTLGEALNGAVVYRAMPNINALVGYSTTAITADSNGEEYKKLVEKLLSCMGTVYWVPEEILDVWTGLAGSGPAFLAEIIDALVLGAVAVGMPRDLAYNAILDVLEGTAKLLKNRRIHPVEMRDEVTTPAGTTIKGLMMLESEGVKAALMKTVEAASTRATEIGEKIDKAIRRELREIGGSTKLMVR